MKRALSQRWMAGSARMLRVGFTNFADGATPTVLPTLEIVAETCRATATRSALASPAEPQPAPRRSVCARRGLAAGKLYPPGDR